MLNYEYFGDSGVASIGRGQAMRRIRLCAYLGLSAVATVMGAAEAEAGGYDIREQSAFFSGTAYAGTAAGGSSLSSIFWNPATSYIVGNGITTDSSYTLVLPEVNLHADTINGDPDFAGDGNVDIGRDAIVPASYAAWRYNAKTVFAVSVNAPVGLTTKPDNVNWAGASLATTSKVFSLNVTPSVSYDVMPGVSVGAGVQLQYLDVTHLNTSGYDADADDIGFGGTAGINITPFRGTSIGLGYRSRIEHDIEGKIVTKVDGLPFTSGDIEATLDTPDKVTLSLRHELAANARLLGTVEWTHWSALTEVPVPLPNSAFTGNIVFNWDDGWFYSIGGEYDLTPKLTLRTGIAYEESPIQQATSRMIQLPDSNRVWFGLGASYKWSDATTINLSYLHCEFEDGHFDRESLIGPPGGTITGRSDVSADAISMGLTMRWGGADAGPAPLK